MQERTFEERIGIFARQLGLPNYIHDVDYSINPDWEYVFKIAGAYSWDERRRMRDSHIPEIRNMPVIAPGAGIAAVSQDSSKKWHILVQLRNNGEIHDEDKEIGLPGGASNLWGYIPKDKKEERIVLEHPMLTAYREWKEEVGCLLSYQISFLTVVTSTNKYARLPDTYATSIYYYVELPWANMIQLGLMRGSSEGAIKVIPVCDLPKYRWFPDAEEPFELIMEKYTDKDYEK